jgi:hypothetical protein
VLLRHFVNPLPGAPKVTLPAADRCIYCGTQDGPLSDEHIIPESIGGKLVLPRAACPCGEEMTHGFEGKVVRQVFQQARRQFGIRGKRRRRSADSEFLPLYDASDGQDDRPPSKKLHPEDHPSMLVLPHWNPPTLLGTRILAHGEKDSPFPADVWHLFDTGRGLRGLNIFEIEQIPFYRFLAKIAHSACVAHLGFGGFTHFLVPIIRGNMERGIELIGETPAEWSGLLPFSFPRGLHEIAVGTHRTPETTYVVVQLRFFSTLLRVRPAYTGLWVRYLPITYAAIAGSISQTT